MSFVSAYLANISGDGESPYFLEKKKNFEMFRTDIHFLCDSYVESFSQGLIFQQ